MTVDLNDKKDKKELTPEEEQYQRLIQRQDELEQKMEAAEVELEIIKTEAVADLLEHRNELIREGLTWFKKANSGNTFTSRSANNKMWKKIGAAGRTGREVNGIMYGSSRGLGRAFRGLG